MSIVGLVALASTASAGELAASDFRSGRADRYDATSGAWLGQLEPADGDLSNEATGVRYAPDGTLYVAGGNSNTPAIVQYDATGAQIRVFADEDDGLTRPLGIDFGPDGDLYVGDGGVIKRFDADRTPLGTFVDPSANGWASKPMWHDGLWYVTVDRQVRTYDAAGVEQATIWEGPCCSGHPQGTAIGPDGALYVSYYPRSVDRVDLGTGITTPFATNGSQHDIGQIAWHDGLLYVATATSGNRLDRYSASGAFVDTFLTFQGVSALYFDFAPTPRAHGTTWEPGDPSASDPEDVFGTLFFEDLWPCAGDFDFNDLVLRYVLRGADTGAAFTELSVFLEVQALGGTIHNGLALKLPTSVPTTATVRTGTPGTGVPWGDAVALPVTLDGGERMVRVVDDLRDLCGATGFVNTAGPTVDCAPIEVTFTFASDPGADFMLGAPFDFFLFQTGSQGHEIHRAPYAPSSQATASLLGTCDDDPANAYEHVGDPPGGSLSGFPWVLHAPEGTGGHPTERSRVDALWEDVVAFVGGGPSDFYANVSDPARLWSDLPPLRFPASTAVDDDVDGFCEGWDHDGMGGTAPVCLGAALPGDPDDQDPDVP